MQTIIWQKADQWLPGEGGGGGMGMRSGQEGVGGMIIKGHKENLGSDEYISYINYGDGFKAEYVCQN